MNEPLSPKWVPASLVRIRCFLNRRGMKVKPWLGPKAVLDAFYDALHSQTKNDDFWSELEQLLGDLANDMRERVAARGWMVRNELLDQPAHAELLTQIRQALGCVAPEKPGLHPLATSLPTRAGALLLMLAAAIVVGCDGGADPSAAAAMGGASNASNGGASAKSATNTKGGSPATDGTQAGAGGATSYPHITISSDPRPLDGLCVEPNVTSGLDPSEFAACNPKLVQALVPYDIHSYSGRQLLECVCVLNDAWQAGFADLFAGQSCASIANYFGDCGLGQLCTTNPSAVPAEFDADLFVDNCAVLLYLGVRCD